MFQSRKNSLFPASSDFETLEELELLHTPDPIEEIRNSLSRETNDYSDDLRIYIR
jgi:hypothetical protein